MTNEIDFEGIDHDPAEIDAILADIDSDTAPDVDFAESDPDEDFEPEQTHKKDVGPKAVQASARAVCQMLDLVQSQLCGLYAGENRARFKMTSEETAEMRAALEPYLEETGVQMPAWAVVLVTAAAIGASKATLAYEVKKAKIEAAQTAQAREMEQQQYAQEYAAAAAQVAPTATPPRVSNYPKARSIAPRQTAADEAPNPRKRFLTDENNTGVMYMRSPAGTYLKADAKRYKMPVAVQVVRDRILAEKGKDVTEKELNRLILDHFGGNPPADEIVNP